MTFSAIILVLCIKQLSFYNYIININIIGVETFILAIIEVFVYQHSHMFLRVLQGQKLYAIPPKYLWYIYWQIISYYIKTL
jgi:hypothetical protein